MMQTHPPSVVMDVLSPAQALWNQREKVLANRDRLQALCDAVDYQNDCALYVWAQWFAVALEFKPDLIIELGRGRGNSTCIFTEAANQLENCQVVSLCLSHDWDDLTRPQVAKVVPDQWFEVLDARVDNILTTDMEAILSNHQRVLFLWDAHGYDIAEYMLGYVMPLLKERQHFVIMHDLSDARYHNMQTYKGNRLWRGNNDGSIKLLLGHIESGVEQAVAIVDFVSRNKITLESADHSLHTELSDDQTTTLKQQLGDVLFSNFAHWFYFSLNQKPETEPVYFPAFQLDILLQEIAERQKKQHNSSPQDEFNSQVLELNSQALDDARKELEQLRTVIAAMESSKFWQLRTIWIKLKRSLGLKA